MADEFVNIEIDGVAVKARKGEMLIRATDATAAFIGGYPLQASSGLSRGFDRYDDEFLRKAGAFGTRLSIWSMLARCMTSCTNMSAPLASAINSRGVFAAIDGCTNNRKGDDAISVTGCRSRTGSNGSFL